VDETLLPPTLMATSQRVKYSETIDAQGMSEETLLQIVSLAVQDTLSVRRVLHSSPFLLRPTEQCWDPAPRTLP
jgi:hypothetical protein